MESINRNKERIINYRYLHDILDYNEYTGIFTWKVQLSSRGLIGSIAGSITQTGYYRVCIGGYSYFSHRLAWLYIYGEWPEDIIDHIDGNTLNNKIDNLRESSLVHNGQNTRKAQINNKYGASIAGVSFYAPKNKWRIRLTIDGERKFFGYYDNKETAENTCLELRRKYYSGNML